ncbi:MAG: hypothetical protein GXP37_00155 [Chloroflexi bacterium]|nr:hypothetical protein [Chloroflexota bacterium]
MLKSYRFLWLVPVLLLALVLTGCGDKPTEVAEQGGEFLLALPRIVVDINSDGVPSITGITPETIKRLTFGQLDLTGMRMDPAYIKWFTRTNLQHVEVVHKNDGLFIFANNDPLPHIAWDGEALQSTGQLASDSGMLDPRVAKVVTMLTPFIQRIGIDIAVRFPIASNAEEIPLSDPGDAMAMLSAQAEESSIAKVRVHIRYDAEGVPSVLSVSTKDLEEALGTSLRQMQLAPQTIKMMQGANIQHILVRTTTTGVLLFVNGKALPHVAWSDAYLKNGADLYGQLYDTPAYQLSREAVTMLLPVLNNIDGEVVLRFPLAEGAEEIPLPNP